MNGRQEPMSGELDFLIISRPRGKERALELRLVGPTDATGHLAVDVIEGG